jgi:hypothetical protein
MTFVIIVLVLLFGVGGGCYYGRRAEWATSHYSSGLLGLILVALLILWVTGNLGKGLMIL